MFKKRKLLEQLVRHKDSPEIIVVTGFRRVGKTALMRHIYEQVTSSNKVFLDLENPLNQRVFETKNYDLIPQALARHGLDASQLGYVFLDEIQFVKNLPSAVKYLFDHYKIKFYLTGSSSFYLKNWFSESLAGRKLLFELWPLDFEEYLWFKDSTYDITAGEEFLSEQYEEYLHYGGFPSVVMTGSPEAKNIELDNILGAYFQLDVKSLAQFRDNRNLRSVLLLLAPRVGSKADMSKLADSLQVSRATVYHYMDFLSQTYLIAQLPAWSRSADVMVRLNPKIYFIDTGLLNRISQVSRGQVFENAVFNQLRFQATYQRPGSPVDLMGYYQTRSGAEIDLIVNGQQAFEVKLNGSVYDLGKLARLAERQKISDYRVVTLVSPTAPHERIVLPYDLSGLVNKPEAGGRDLTKSITFGKV